MRISDLFRSSSLSQNTKAVDAEQLRDGRDRVLTQNNEEGADQVNISVLSRRLSRVSRIVADEDERQSDRVASIKAKLDSGAYKVDSDKIAKSIVNYAS